MNVFPLRYSLITAKNPDRLTKQFSQGADGPLIKSAAGNLIEGHVRHASARDLQELAAQLDEINSDQAPTWGLSVSDSALVVTQDEVANRPGAIARDRAHFKFDTGPGVMMLDHDAMRPGSPGLNSNALVAYLYAACPALALASMLIRASVTAGIVDRHGRVLAPLTRWRIYIPVSNAADIPAAGARLITRLWSAGLGWFKVSRDGKPLAQTILDGSVWQPERLDFAARPVLCDGLRRDVPPSCIYIAKGQPPVFDLASITVDAEVEQSAAANRARARQDVEVEARLARTEYLAAEAPRLAAARGVSVDQAKSILVAASDHDELVGNFIVTLADGREISVDELLAQRSKYDGARMHDPMEPSYRDDPRIAVALLTKDSPEIFSHAHGGRRYRLFPDPIGVFSAPYKLPPGVTTTPPAPTASGRRYALMPDDPLNGARALVQRRFTHPEGPCLKFWQGAFYQWSGAHWVEMTEGDARAQLYDFLDQNGASYYRPTQSKVSVLVDALKHAPEVHVDSTHAAAPCWLGGDEIAPAAELVACSNGLLHLPTRAVLTPTPRFFNLNATPFAYDPHAPAPTQWLQFLAQVWPDDPEAIATLQEVFGYLLTPDTSQQKIFLLVGPKRSGKGTLARVLTEMLGATANVANPTLASMATTFGLAPLLGKLAAIISDARLSGRTDQKEVAENLLRISGEDRVEVERKFRDSIAVRLGVRFVLLTNELPRIADASGAMASRFVILTMRQSFFGREDPGLTTKLLRELPCILAWAVEGWHRLNARGHFIEPKSSAGAAQELADLGSPISAFLRDECTVSPITEVETSKLYDAWRTWCAQQGIQHSGTQQVFGRDLKAAAPSITLTQPRVGGERIRVYRGVALTGTHWHAVRSIVVPAAPIPAQ